MKSGILALFLIVTYQAYADALLKRAQRTLGGVVAETVSHYSAEGLSDVVIFTPMNVDGIDFPSTDFLISRSAAPKTEYLSGLNLTHFGSINAPYVNEHAISEFTPQKAPFIEDVEMMYKRFVYEGLTEGTLNPRRQECRSALLQMLVDTPAGIDFDGVFTYLVLTFPGGGDEAKTKALLAWLKQSHPDDVKAHGSVLFALSRKYISLGQYEQAILSAQEMSALNADYKLKSHSIKAHAYAFSGEYEKAKLEIKEGTKSSDGVEERSRFDFLMAWILLQEGDVDDAVPLLKRIVREKAGEFSGRAKIILESLGERGE